MRLPRSISTQHMGSVVAFLIAGSMVSFALGQQIGHAAYVPQQPATSYQSQLSGALGAHVAVPAPQRPVAQPVQVAQTAPASSHTQPAVALVRAAPATAHADPRHDDNHHGDNGGHSGHGDKHGGGGSDGNSGGREGD